MDEPVPIEGIIEGEPESLAAVCAAGGSAIVAYCAAVGAQTRVAETVVAALSTFRRGVVEHADRDPGQLEKLLVASAVDAARRVAGVDPSPVQQAAAQVALETAETAPLARGLARRIIHALVEAAPVTALDGDAAAVRRATEQHYVRMFDGQQRAAGTPAAATARPPRPATPAAWVPPELREVDIESVNAGAVLPPEQWESETGKPADAPAEPLASAETLATPPPGALVIKRGGHWPFRRRPRKPKPHGGGPAGAKSVRNAIIAGVAGLAIGAGITAVAMPEEEVQPAILVRPLDTPFTVEDAVFNIVRTNQAPWALEIRRRPLRSGRTWITLSVQTRNISRPNFLPRSLGYRLRTATGIVIGPDTAQVPDAVTAARGVQAPGERASVHLGFQIPIGERGVTLEFDPVPAGDPRIRVPLN